MLPTRSKYTNGLAPGYTLGRASLYTFYDTKLSLTVPTTRITAALR